MFDQHGVKIAKAKIEVREKYEVEGKMCITIEKAQAICG